jgi:hypothetical protein
MPQDSKHKFEIDTCKTSRVISAVYQNMRENFEKRIIRLQHTFF